MRNKILMCLAWACVLCGCHSSAPHDDLRLVAADSLLLANNPDSALQVLESINASSLDGAANRAYHALLLTQAQYRCYVDINSDSIINVALNYYKHHNGEQERLARAYIYKGAVTEVVGDAEAAMAIYKQAQSVAAPGDHSNLGYANLRIGSLYRDYLISDSSAIQAVKDALYHFEQVNDSSYILKCLSAIGGIYAAKDIRDSAIVYLERADTLAHKLQLEADELNNTLYLIDLMMFGDDADDIDRAKSSALKLLNSDIELNGSRDHVLMDAAYALALLNKPDSAQLHLNQVDKDRLDDGMLVLYESCLAEIARCRKDVEQFKRYYDSANNRSDSLTRNNMQRQLRDVEAKYDNEALRYEALKYKTHWQLLLLGALLAVSILVITLMVIARKAARRKQQLAASEDTIERLKSDADQLEAMLKANQEMSDGLKATIKHQINTFSQLVEMHHTQFTQFPKKFDELFKKAYGLNQPDLSFWAGLRAYADSTCNNIITRTVEAHPSMSENDVRFLSLCSCDLPTSAIMACLGFSDLHSVYRKKRFLARKLELKCKLDDYIAEFMPEEPAAE